MSIFFGAALLSVLSSFGFGWLGSESAAVLLAVSASQVLVSAIYGMILGWVQWFALRRYCSPTWLWISVNAIAMLMSQVVEQVIFHITLDATVLVLTNLLLSASLSAAITGATLVVLLDRPLAQGTMQSVSEASTAAERRIEARNPTFVARYARWLVLANLVLGTLLWFFFCTDYSLAGTLPDIVFPPAMGVLGGLALLTAKYLRSKARQRLARLATL